MWVRVALIVACMLAAGVVAVHATLPAEQWDVPTNWGMPMAAPTEQPETATAIPVVESNEIRSLMLTPRATIVVGTGTVDAATYLRRQSTIASSYTVRAPRDSIVEYLFPMLGFFQPGSPLVRLYDTQILPDIEKAEDAARHYLDQPFTILGPQPASAYPSPTGAQAPARIRIEQPISRQGGPETDTVEVETSPDAAPARVLGIARQSGGGFSVEAAEKQPSEAAEDFTAKAKAAAAEVAELAEQLSAMRDDLSKLQSEEAGLPEEIAKKQSELSAADEELAGRESLYQSGVLARNALEAYREKHSALAVELSKLRKRDGELSSAMESLRSQIGELEGRIDQAKAVAAESRGAAEKQVARTKPAAQPTKLPGLPVTNPAPIEHAVAQTTSTSRAAQPRFPNPLGDMGQGIDPGVEALADNIERLAAEERQRARAYGDMPPVPQALVRLGQPRWEVVTSPTSGMVTDTLVPEGDQVKAGTDILRVANTQWATVYADLLPEYLGDYRQGSPVLICFHDYPGTEFQGWIHNLMPSPDSDAIRAEICLSCRRGYFGSDAYATLEWLSHAAPLDAASVDTRMTPSYTTYPDPMAAPISACSLLPLAPVSTSVGKVSVKTEVPGMFVGHVQVAEICAADEACPVDPEEAGERLQKLNDWRKSFTEGMTTTIFADKLVLTYPAKGEVKSAIEKMASGGVTHVKNRCARTMAEALGWGLGDAADWAHGLPRRGYRLREDGLCRPGDILVWRFTYGPRMNQHVGFAVLQGGRMMLLSNSAGRLGTSEILPGYLAFHKPSADEASAN
jgi:multidrug resistance efflux pump